MITSCCLPTPLLHLFGNNVNTHNTTELYAGGVAGWGDGRVRRDLETKQLSFRLRHGQMILLGNCLPS